MSRTSLTAGFTSWKHLPPARAVSLVCFSTHGATVWVVDNGKGIDAEDRVRVLEPLVRLHRDGDAPGSGLGLAICRRIAEAHGGELSLTETPGGGTTVAIAFPAG